MDKKETFEEKLEKLESLVKNLESGDIPLDKAIDSFNKATVLSKECNDILINANEVVSKMLNKDGTFEEFKVEE